MALMPLGAAAAVLGASVMIHELAHVVAARRAGARVREVGVGFGPVIARGEVRGVPVSLRAVPLGGFAAVDVEGLPPRQRAPVLLAGPLANVAAGLLLRAAAGAAAPATPLPGGGGRVGMGGIISAVHLLGRAAGGGARTLARAAGDVNLSVGLANLLPFVPLDGGHLAVARLESAGATRETVGAFRFVTAAFFLWTTLAVLLSDMARVRSAARPDGSARR